MIIYFSGTGNSKYVADMLSEQLNDQSIDAGKMIKSGIKGEFESKHPWVFVAPTYSWQLPHVFEKFIKESTFKGAKTAYFIMTCGGDIGNAQSQIINICNEIDLEYKGVAEVIMPDNYVAMYPVSSEEESENIIKKAIPIIQKCVNVIKEDGVLQHKKIVIADKIKSSVVNPLFYRFMAKSKKFNVTKDKCVSCGKCSNICPLNNIKLIDALPKWGNNCTHCMACISYCPTKAIEYGKISVGKRRYKCKTYNKEDINYID